MSGAPAEGFEVEDLTPAALLEVARANEAEIRRRELDRLRLAYQWAVLHPVTDQSGVQTPDGAAFSVLERPDSLGGDGTPPVAAFAHEIFALALGMTPAAGAALVGDSLDLRHRLPLLWDRVSRLEVPAWQARRVATQTRRLPLAGARWVDEQLNLRSDGACGPVITDRLVAQAAADLDPQSHQDREEEAEHASWGVDLTHPDPVDYSGTSHLTATGETPTLVDFHRLVCTLAHQLGQAGDTSPLGVRKITAIRIITQLATIALTGQQTLDPNGAADLADLDAETLNRLATAVARHGAKIKLIAHLDTADLEVTPDGETALATGRIERLGAATIARLRAFVAHSAVQILPVLNMDRRDAVDGHDPPPWMQELVILRDGHCIFPGCTIDARGCDLDHLIPYVPLDQGGPPGQTHPGGLAPLCRRHHRAKTTGRWRYHLTPDGYLWHGPYGTRFLKSRRGTTRLP